VITDNDLNEVVERVKKAILFVELDAGLVYQMVTEIKRQRAMLDLAAEWVVGENGFVTKEKVLQDLADEVAKQGAISNE
jgi:hypothetical protein